MEDEKIVQEESNYVPHKRGRKSKFSNEEERKIAQLDKYKKYYTSNREKILKKAQLKRDNKMKLEEFKRMQDLLQAKS